ncbi:hypothetical protein OBV_44130 [Oscillibacter valericigenes Sjm18-20]|nr:hypothetical protein OBV_44130 [Oscillibacter valericigenes Sjm18-20]
MSSGNVVAAAKALYEGHETIPDMNYLGAQPMPHIFPGALCSHSRSAVLAKHTSGLFDKIKKAAC